MKTLKIEVPEGHEIDKEKSTFEEIVFRPIKKQLPKSWEELGKIEGYWVSSSSLIHKDVGFDCVANHKSIFATEAQARAAIALAQLSQLRGVYRAGWVPDWKGSKSKHVIERRESEITKTYYSYSSYFLSFQSREIRDQFLENFKDLIEEASPLLFG